MKTIFRFGCLCLVLAAACLAGAEENATEALAVKSPMHNQLASLVRADAGAFAAPAPVGENNDATEVTADDTLKLETMTVKGEKVVIPPPRHESATQEFLRTGVVWEKVGPRFTRRLWMKGDRGLMFTIAW